MNIVIYIICFLLFVRYVFVLTKYIKTGVFKKKKYKGNILGIIAYTFLTILIIDFLILMVLVNKNIFIDVVAWIFFFSVLGVVFMYPWFWRSRIYESTASKNEEIVKKEIEDFTNKYGDSDTYDTLKLNYFRIPDDVKIDEVLNKIVYYLTNEQISFIHPNEHNNIHDVCNYLFQEDYVKLLLDNDSIYLTIEKVNSLLKKNKLKLEIKADTITKKDDDKIKARRYDLVPTVTYDLNTINEVIKKKLKDYELVTIMIYSKTSSIEYPTYYCIVKTSEYEKLFGKIREEKEND